MLTELNVDLARILPVSTYFIPKCVLQYRQLFRAALPDIFIDNCKYSLDIKRGVRFDLLEKDISKVLIVSDFSLLKNNTQLNIANTPLTEKIVGNVKNLFHIKMHDPIGTISEFNIVHLDCR